MKKEQLVALLGRPLSNREDSNYEQYMEEATSYIESLLCMPLRFDDETHIFNGRDGYSTLYTGIHTDVIGVRVDGEIISPEKYHSAFFDNRNSRVFNSIIFSKKLRARDVIEVDAVWGFECYPADIKSLIAKAFLLVSQPLKAASNVKSKKVEDFSITYSDSTKEEQFEIENSKVISKYSLCNLGYIRHGEVC